MKSTNTFKTLVDFVYIILVFGLVSMIIILPFGTLSLGLDKLEITENSLAQWAEIVLGTLSYIIMLRGIYFLRKVAKDLLSKNQFADAIILNLKNSGRHFVLVGILSMLGLAGKWIVNLFDGNMQLTLGSNALLAIFLVLIGLFFIIQSSTLYQAKAIKEENELMV